MGFCFVTDEYLYLSGQMSATMTCLNHKGWLGPRDNVRIGLAPDYMGLSSDSITPWSAYVQFYFAYLNFPSAVR